VGNPSNFARIMDLFSIYPDPYKAIRKRISGRRYTDEEIAAAMRDTYNRCGYILDPHGACGYQALADDGMQENETGLFLETAHPAKFKNIVDKVLDIDIEIPDQLQAFMKGKKQCIELGKDFAGFKKFLLER
jgi:threonine synthase